MNQNKVVDGRSMGSQRSNVSSGRTLRLLSDRADDSDAFLRHFIEYALLRGSGDITPVWGQG